MRAGLWRTLSLFGSGKLKVSNAHRTCLLCHPCDDIKLQKSDRCFTQLFETHFSHSPRWVLPHCAMPCLVLRLFLLNTSPLLLRLLVMLCRRECVFLYLWRLSHGALVAWRILFHTLIVGLAVGVCLALARGLTWVCCRIVVLPLHLFT